MKLKSVLVAAISIVGLQAHAQVTVATPSNGATVNTPFNLKATSTKCSTQPVSSMGYSLDNSSQTTILKGATSINVNVTSPTGSHVLHVKSWGNSGSACSDAVSLKVAVTPPPPPSGPVIPAGANSVKDIQTRTNWEQNWDPGSSKGSTAKGSRAISTNPALDGMAMECSMSFTDGGGYIYHDSFASDANATHFVYDNYVYIDSTADIGNLEMDMNQVLSNGDTMIYGFQCAGDDGVWEYTKNAGTAAKHVDTWVHSTAKCNPKDWTPNTWHHIQVAYFRDDSGNITYQSVWLDGVESTFNATVFSEFQLGWSVGTLLTNFQIDGKGTSGSATVYTDKMTVYYW